jgi:membrane-associated protease RseP (regulator of RpoE activity)
MATPRAGPQDLRGPWVGHGALELRESELTRALRFGEMLFYWMSLGVGLLATLLIHELGHFLAARWCGVRVISFSIGVGPQLLAFTDRWGTRWRLAALPLGASVGMRHKPQSGDPFKPRSQADHSDAFSVKSIKQRATIYVAGPVFNLLFAIGLMVVVLAFHGNEVVRNASVDHSDIVLEFMVSGQSDIAVALMVSGLSISIGVFNLLPFLPLDGGRLFFLGIEALRAKPLLDHVQVQLSRVGFIVVFTLSLSLIFGLTFGIGG